MSASIFILAALSLVVASSEWLCRHTPLRHLGTALLVILLAALLVNAGVIPSATESVPSPIYGVLLGPVAELAIFWLLLRVNLRELRRAGGAMILAFLLGSLGTFTGVLVGLRVLGGDAPFGQHTPGVGAMFVGTYTGGSVNFNAMAKSYGILGQGPLYAAAAVVDSVMTTIWMAVTLLAPRLLGARPRPRSDEALEGEQDGDTESLSPLDLGWLLAAGAVAVLLSTALTEGTPVPSILVLTTLALIGAHVPGVRDLRGTRTLGMFGVYLFLAAIGALCDFSALAQVGDVGGRLFAMASIALVVHGLFVLATARVLRLQPEVAAVASQANVGGATSALALARSLGRSDLVLPAILVGALGNALGNYLGILAALLLA